MKIWNNIRDVNTVYKVEKMEIKSVTYILCIVLKVHLSPLGHQDNHLLHGRPVEDN